MVKGMYIFKKIIVFLIGTVVTIILPFVCLEMFLRVYPILVRPFATTTDVGLYVVGESTGFGEPFGPQISYPKIISFM
ncbi:MAG: hypothetical protein WCG51_04785, partial [Elusimicrobiota bacterium]